MGAAEEGGKTGGARTVVAAATLHCNRPSSDSTPQHTPSRRAAGGLPEVRSVCAALLSDLTFNRIRCSKTSINSLCDEKCEHVEFGALDDSVVRRICSDAF